MCPEELVGVPWVRHGRAIDGADCWGLACLYYARVLSLRLPDFGDEMAAIGADAAGRHALIERAAVGWRRVEPGDERPHDIVLLRAGRVHEHVGVALGSGLMLHSEGPEPAASVIQRIDSPSLRCRLVCFFRHPQVHS
jgi:cell wall-associated NlpC family hydrolase